MISAHFAANMRLKRRIFVGRRNLDTRRIPDDLDVTFVVFLHGNPQHAQFRTAPYRVGAVVPRVLCQDRNAVP